MIVRILGEGQYDLEGTALQELKLADAHLFEAVASNNEVRFAQEFHKVLTLVRTRGQRLDASRLTESDLVLPSSDTSLEEARRLFTSHPA